MAIRDLDELFAALARSGFRRRFRLAERGLTIVLEHARSLVQQRLAPAAPRNDGRQTPWRGHPVFVAQHATATCCRGCLQTWHRLERGRPLTDPEIDYVLAVLARWLGAQIPAAPQQQAPSCLILLGTAGYHPHDQRQGSAG